MVAGLRRVLQGRIAHIQTVLLRVVLFWSLEVGFTQAGKGNHRLESYLHWIFI